MRYHTHTSIAELRGCSTEHSCMVQMHHLLNNGAVINQRDEKGFTPLHRAAYLAQHDGYLELYEYLLVRPCLLAACMHAAVSSELSWCRAEAQTPACAQRTMMHTSALA